MNIHFETIPRTDRQLSRYARYLNKHNSHTKIQTKFIKQTSSWVTSGSFSKNCVYFTHLDNKLGQYSIKKQLIPSLSLNHSNGIKNGEIILIVKIVTNYLAITKYFSYIPTPKYFSNKKKMNTFFLSFSTDLNCS